MLRYYLLRLLGYRVVSGQNCQLYDVRWCELVMARGKRNKIVAVPHREGGWHSYYKQVRR